MIIPEEVIGRVCRTKLSGFSAKFSQLDKVRKEWPGSEIDVIYEGTGLTHRSVVVIVFESAEDCVAFKLRYGDEYV